MQFSKFEAVNCSPGPYEKKVLFIMKPGLKMTLSEFQPRYQSTRNEHFYPKLDSQSSSLEYEIYSYNHCNNFLFGCYKKTAKK